MTIKSQKVLEILYAEKTGELLGELWKVSPAPNEIVWPDLLVATKTKDFGLEVREIYLDESRKGSIKKANEKNNLVNIKKLAEVYYKERNPSIRADFLGDINNQNKLINAMKETAHQLLKNEYMKIEPYDGCQVHIYRLPNRFGEYKRWRYVNDIVGWVGDVDKNAIQRSIHEKAINLTKYRKNISDVRLLLVSNRVFNSGKCTLKNNFVCDPCGFKRVYYLSYPYQVWQIGGSGDVP